MTFTGSDLFQGMYADIWSVLSQRLNFTTKLTRVSSTEGWNYMINSVKNQSYDLVLSGNSQTYSRSKIIDFSFPLQMSSLR